MHNNKMKRKIKLHNVILKPEYVLVKICTAINNYCKAEEARKRFRVKMAQLLHLGKQGRKSRPQHIHSRSLSFKHFVVVVEEEETIYMQQEREEIFKINKDQKKRRSSRDRESSSPAAAADEGEGGKKSKSSSTPLVYTIPRPPLSFSKFVSKKTSKLISFSKWSINYDKMMMMKTIVKGACVYVVREGEGEDPGVCSRRRKKAGRSSDDDDEKEGYELCRKRILMGERCKPLNNSGKLQYDETGILLPEDICT